MIKFIDNIQTVCENANKHTQGVYLPISNKIYIKKGLSFKTTIKVLSHEFGHYLIKNLFKRNNALIQYWWDITWCVFEVPEELKIKRIRGYFKMYNQHEFKEIK